MSIEFENGVFHLQTENTSYIFRISEYGHPVHMHYGALVQTDDASLLSIKNSIQRGSSVMYSRKNDRYCLDTMCLEWSGIGRGDYRQSPIEMKKPNGSFSSDFVFESWETTKGCVKMSTLPSAYDGMDDAETLHLTLADKDKSARLHLYYTVFAAVDVITRRCVIENCGEGEISLRRLMSMSLDIPDRGFVMHTFDGGWIKETHRNKRSLEQGMYVNSSTTGSSSNRHNPGFILSGKYADEDKGCCYGFNLVYSGNHMGLCEKSNCDLLRVQIGINPHCFEWNLTSGESFETPEAVMSFSLDGLNGLSHNFHRFVNNCIVRGEWKNKERPVLINNWEANFFKFDKDKLLRLARSAKKLGVELFVLDDGWFGDRNSDTAGLGDYNVNTKKLPGGLSALGHELNKLGLDFGLWFEPESVNEDSELYRTHPDWAVLPPQGEAVLGRNQLLLDLTKSEVRDYIVESVGKVLDSAPITYVKWDMNRHLADAYSPSLLNQGEFYHRYTMGLYDCLERIFTPRPDILLESCSSGGNRFDLGMLCYSPQIWSSDDTDPIERLEIQAGLSYLYPQSCMGAHVSAAPHQQTLRNTPLSTRFNVAAFGVLGYELDLKYLNHVELKEVKEQIAYYKKYRRTLQFGRFYRENELKDNTVHWQVSSPDGKEHIAGHFQKLCSASPSFDELKVKGLDGARRYRIKCKPQRIFVKRVGGLVKHILPFELDPDGAVLRTANKYAALPDGGEEYIASGAALGVGMKLNDQFMGTGYNSELHMFGDFGSALYSVEATE